MSYIVIAAFPLFNHITKYSPPNHLSKSPQPEGKNINKRGVEPPVAPLFTLWKRSQIISRKHDETGLENEEENEDGI